MARDGDNSTVYAFDGFRLDVVKRLLYGPDGNAVALKAKAFDTLLYLVENSGRVVERDELLAAVWPDTVVEENNLTQHISSLRRLFGEKPDEHRFIATVAGRGYMFVADVRGDSVEPLDADAAPASKKPSRKLLGIMVTVLVAAILVLGFFYKNLPESTSASPKKKIAVLPFKPLSDSSDDRQRADAMTLALISKLERAAGISVYPYAEVRRFNSPDQEAITAGQELGADIVIDATMQVTPDPRVRVNVRFLSTSDSKQLGLPDAFDEDYKDMLAAQDSMSERIASALRAQLSAYAKKHYTDNNDAYRQYLQGRVELSKLAPPDMINQAIRSFQKAIDRDPKYALAYTGISDANMSLVLSSEEHPGEYGQLAIDAAKRAVDIDPELAEGHRNCGITAFWFERDWKSAEAAFTRALELDPNSAPTRLHYAHFLSNMGLHQQATEQVEDARKLDSLSAYSFAVQGLVYHHQGNLNEAVARFDQAILKGPGVWLPHMFKAAVKIDLKEYEAALQAARSASAINRGQTMSVALESFALAKLGQRDEARKILGWLLVRSQQRYVPPYHIAIAYMGLGDHENALARLEQSYSEKDAKIVFLKVDRIWDPVRSDSRFVALLDQLNF